MKDLEIARIARLSRGIKDEIGGSKSLKELNDDLRLFHDLWDWGHLSVFEFLQITFYIECPIFTARQVMRHRTGRYLERSLRYSKAENPDFYYFGMKTNGEVEGTLKNTQLYNAYKNALHTYKLLLDEGIKPEEARTVLPMGIYTQFYWQIDARNLFHFLELRINNHAQQNIRDLSFMILEELRHNEMTKNIYKLYIESLKEKSSIDIWFEKDIKPDDPAK